MEHELVKTFRFEAAHCLPNAPEGHKCRRMHGHSYRVDIHVTGQPDPESGWVVDFGEIKRIVGDILDGELDHRNLNEIPGLENSTSERLGEYLWNRITPQLPGLSAITIWESDSSRCTVRG
ncbi:MAG: 6-carboxytetrahydropterin synthase QueD [Planctomycetota bacterium]|jgi:6-pyruvoyltetrahydropterin/6-carboxytetrahydropterin synthase